MCLLIPKFSKRKKLPMKLLTIFLLLFLINPAFAQTKTYDTLPNMPEHYVTRYQLFQKEPVILGRVVMVGNSITEGANWKVLLKDTTIINRGISGDVTFGVLNRLKEITDRKPSKLFLLIGVNDLSRNTPDEVIIKNIFNSIEKIHSQSPATAIYIQSILPTNESFKNLNKAFREKGEHVKTINTQLKKYGKKRKYTYVDLYSNFLDTDGKMDSKFTYDGLHLNATGYDHWVEILKKEKYL
jgi:lysophospholipase L1-like esterase